MICEDCGQQLWEGVRFCPNCGVRVTPAIPRDSEHAEAQVSEVTGHVPESAPEPVVSAAGTGEGSPAPAEAAEVRIVTNGLIETEIVQAPAEGQEKPSGVDEQIDEAGLSQLRAQEGPAHEGEIPPQPEQPAPPASPGLTAERSQPGKRRLPRVAVLAIVGAVALIAGVVTIVFNPFAGKEELEQIDVGSTADGTIEGEMNVVYEFEGADGQVVSAYVEYDEGNSRFVDILDAEGRALSETAAARLPSNDTYRIAVGRDHEAKGSTYTLSLDEVSPESLTIPATIDVPADAGEVKLYTIDMSEQAPLVATVVQGDGFAGETNIVDVDATQMGQLPLATIRGSRSRLVTQETGTVGIEVAPLATGEFSLRVEPVPPGVLVPGAWTTIKVEGVSALVDLFVPAPQDFEVVAKGKKGFDPALTLHDPAGQIVAQSDGSSRGTVTTLPASATVAGTYRIEVGSADGATGSVDLGVE